MSKAERTRQYIIEKTAPIFNTKGYAGTSLHDMTEATGLTKGSIYGNFENKDEVAVAAFRHNAKLLWSHIQAEVNQNTSYKEKLLAYPKVYKKLFSQPLIIGGCPLVNTATEADDTHPLLRKEVSQAMEGWKKELVNLIEKGIQAGEFKEINDPEQEALTIIATIEGAITITKLTGKSGYLKKMMDALQKQIQALT